MRRVTCVVMGMAMMVSLGLDAVAAKIPSEADCKAARGKLAELTADDYKSLKSKSKTNEQVGDALMGYAENEKSAAGKYALTQDAFKQFVLGKSFDKAASAYTKAQTDGGTEYALEMMRPMRTKLFSMASSKNPGAKSLKERIASDEKSLQRVRAVRKQLKENPGDESLCEQLGIEYAAIGDWESALAAFLTASGQVAKIADWELNGGKGADFTAAKVAAFWWKFAGDFPKRQNVEESVKLHAAMWYKLALDKDAFEGNEKTIVEKRIAEAAKFEAAARKEQELAAKKTATVAPIKLELSKDVVVELMGCPAGEFVMGCAADKKSFKYKHTVKITRPFWMSKYKVQRFVWDVFEKSEFPAGRAYSGGKKGVYTPNYSKTTEFFRWLNTRAQFKKVMPKGYVFRLPTEAEWEYALNAGGDAADAYIMFRDGKMGAGSIAYTYGDYKESCANPADDGWVYGCEGGVKKPNAWGLYDMLGSGGDMTLDVIGPDKDGNYECSFLYQDKETDPLRFSGEASAKHVKRSPGNYFTASWFGKCFNEDDGWSAFHIVLGPDLMKEKGFQEKPKKKPKKR